MLEKVGQPKKAQKDWEASITPAGTALGALQTISPCQRVWALWKGSSPLLRGAYDPSVETKEQRVIRGQKYIVYYLRFSEMNIRNGAVHYRLEHKISLSRG